MRAGVAVLVAALAACAGPSVSTSIEDYASLVAGLRAAGRTVEARGDLLQPFFSVPGRLLAVDGEPVQVFEYRAAGAAEADAARVSSDGHVIGNSHVTWLATPHFYKKARLIVLYVGEHRALNELLATLLGPRFAGG